MNHVTGSRSLLAEGMETTTIPSRSVALKSRSARQRKREEGKKRMRGRIIEGVKKERGKKGGKERGKEKVNGTKRKREKERERL